MKKFQGILIATDLDGTLLRRGGTVSDENKKAIEYFKDNGGIFTFVTGRPPIIVGDIYSRVLPNGPIGCFNGSGIFDMEKKTYLWKKGLQESFLELVEHVDKTLPEMSIQLCGFDKCYFCKMNSSMIRHRDHAGFEDIRCHYKDVKESVAKVLFAHEVEEELFRLMDILHAHPRANEFDFIRSEQEFYEIVPKGLSKGELLYKLADLLGIDRKRTIAIGDNDNDASMIKNAGIGIAVSNASPAAKAVADIITVSNEEHAIAKLIYDIEQGIIEI